MNEGFFCEKVYRDSHRIVMNPMGLKNPNSTFQVHSLKLSKTPLRMMVSKFGISWLPRVYLIFSGANLKVVSGRVVDSEGVVHPLFLLATRRNKNITLAHHGNL